MTWRSFPGEENEESTGIAQGSFSKKKKKIWNPTPEGSDPLLSRTMAQEDNAIDFTHSTIKD